MTGYRLIFELSDFTLVEMKSVTTGKVLRCTLTWALLPLDGDITQGEAFTCAGCTVRREKDGKLTFRPPETRIWTQGRGQRWIRLFSINTIHHDRLVMMIQQSEWDRYIGDLWQPPVNDQYDRNKVKYLDTTLAYLPKSLSSEGMDVDVEAESSTLPE